MVWATEIFITMLVYQQPIQLAAHIECKYMYLLSWHQ